MLGCRLRVSTPTNSPFITRLSNNPRLPSIVHRIYSHSTVVGSAIAGSVERD